MPKGFSKNFEGYENRFHYREFSFNFGNGNGFNCRWAAVLAAVTPSVVPSFVPSIMTAIVPFSAVIVPSIVPAIISAVVPAIATVIIARDIVDVAIELIAVSASLIHIVLHRLKI